MRIDIREYDMCYESPFFFSIWIAFFEKILKMLIDVRQRDPANAITVV